MVWRALGLVVALKFFAAILNHRLRRLRRRFQYR